MMNCTGIFIQVEPSTAEVDSPLFPHTLFHQTVEDEDEKSWNMKTWINVGQWPLLLFWLMKSYKPSPLNKHRKTLAGYIQVTKRQKYIK